MNALSPYDNQPQDAVPLVGTDVWNIFNLNKSFLEDYDFVDDNFIQQQYISTQSRDLLTFLDQEFIALRSHLNGQRLVIASVEGASGRGKSTEVWGWFLLQQYNRAWVHCYHSENSPPEYGIVKITLIKDEWNYERGFFTHTEDMLATVNGVALLVVDGVMTAGYEQILKLVKATHAFLVTVITGKSDTVKDSIVLHFRHRKFIVNGFTLQEYINAEQALGSVNNRGPKTMEEITERYYYCGGYGRYYWRIDSSNELIELITAKVRWILNFSTFFQGEEVGAHSTDVLSSLLTLQDNMTVFVSEFVCKLVYEKVDIGFIQSLKDLLPNNPTWLSWVTKLEFLYYCKQVQSSENKSLELRYRNLEKPPFKHRIQKIVKFDRLDSITPTVPQENVVGSAHQVLYVPLLWCNEGYDAIYIEYHHENGEVRPFVSIFQCTIAGQHDYRLQYAASLLEQLFPLQSHVILHFLSPRIFYYVITTKENVNAFDMDSGDEEGLDSIRKFDPTFSDLSYEICYFDQDINYIRKRDLTT